MTRFPIVLEPVTTRGVTWGQSLVRHGIMASAAVHLLAGALLWVSGWWPRGATSDLVMPYPPEQDFASISVPPTRSQPVEDSPLAALEIAPQFQSPETRPLEPAETTLPRAPMEALSPRGDPVSRPSPADHLGPEGAPRIDPPQRETRAEQPPTEDLPDLGLTTGSIARTRSGVETRITPRALLNPAPTYPSDALARRLEGVVLLQVEVDAAGAVTNIQLVRTSGVKSLDDAALAAVRQWRFLPARDPATPPRRVNIPIEFVIRDR